MSSIGKNIQAFREERGLSLEELATKMRVGKETIEKYELGEKTPNNQTILKLSTVLDVPASVLLKE
ncbi:helix-turn-helix domain-containing protein [Mesobacillus maritimus]|uniref:helix-turn-helix domain-containing protein n=1 Tax=Mesobacillus maritimus TaxID=1643336 RepID=UPI00203C0E33|nr:helix-turn-helix transcriptional regulator [Mesobacillus maritimus]MCM3588446.1 helix-turn-helix domain-containing protein [Mesobacillus maritimus]MCM3670217.1 helix-turn-helix domain-containing protein [Mesobacillus maritimus]